MYIHLSIQTVSLSHVVQAACVAKLKEETVDYPQLQDFEDSTPADGRSTAAASSVGTPMANGHAGTKLKLTFNKGNVTDGYTNGGGSAMASDDD